MAEPGARALGLALVLGLACAPSGRGEPSAAFARARARGAPAEREWRTYLGDRAVAHGSPLTQIDRSNVARLAVAWTYDAGDASPRNVSQIQFNPLIVKGVLYGASPSLRLFALDAATGAELWSFSPRLDVKTWMPCRGAVYWEDGDDERILFGAGPYLHALDARTGRLIRAFGDGGRVDLRLGLGRDVSGDLMGVLATTPGTLFQDLLIQGGRVNEAAGAAPGVVRAFDVRTGAVRWTFHLIPQPGELGHETWPPDAWQTAGGANAWAGFSLDPERGLVFVPTGSATPDFFGGDRAGENLFASSLVALDARTGERRWHQQLVRHDIWDRDLPAPPNLVEIVRDGERVRAVAQVTKMGDTFVFRRDSGEPLFPIVEEPVQGAGVPGEASAASEPRPAAPPPFARQGFSLADVTDRSPEAHAQVSARVAGMRYGALYVPPSVEGSIARPGTDGGAEWGGAAWDAGSGLLYVNANEAPAILKMVQLPASTEGARMAMAQGYVFACSACHGLDLRGDGASVPSLVGVGNRLGPLAIYRILRDGRGRMPAMGGLLEWWQGAALAWWVYSAKESDTPIHWAAQPTEHPSFGQAGYQDLRDADGLPGVKPPWGTLTAIDLSAGTLRWQIPLGDYPETLAEGRHGLGAQNYGGPVVSAGGLLFLAATPDERIRAFDKASGALLWEAPLPAAGFATPATYEADGRQFVVIAAGGGKLRRPSGSQYVAFALPRK